MKFGSLQGHVASAALLRGAFVKLVVLVGLAALAGCGSAGTQSAPPTTAPSLSITPASVTTAVGGRAVAFSATLNGAGGSVTWEVNGVPGGNGTVGTISASGQYTSPAAMPSSPTVQVSAVSAADPTVSASASLTLTGATVPVGVSVSPGNATVLAGSGTQTFTATVSNATNTAVTWQVNGVTGGDATLGTISAAGLYTAPATPPAQPTVRITAVSVADPTTSGSATATVAATAPPVASGTTGSATVSWTPPTTRTDGSTLTNLAGYRIYYGTSQGNYSHTISVANVGLTSYVVTDLPGGATYYFVATSYDTNGEESPYSNVASKAIP
jgi:hypothetical protein